MSKRDAWDKLNRQAKALKEPYQEDFYPLQKPPRVVSAETRARQAETMVQQQIDTLLGGPGRKLTISPAMDQWLKHNVIDKAKLQAALPPLLSQLRRVRTPEEPQQAKAILQVRSLIWNQMMNEAYSIAAFHMPAPPAEFAPWLLTFKRGVASTPPTAPM